MAVLKRYTGTSWEVIGGGASTTRVGVRLRRAAAQTVNSNAVTTVSWDTEDQDTNAFIAVTGTTITIPAGQGGVYSISVKVVWSALINNRHMFIITAGGRAWRINGSDNAEEEFAGGVTVALAAADTVTVDVYQISGTSKTMTAMLEMFKVSA